MRRQVELAAGIGEATLIKEQEKAEAKIRSLIDVVGKTASSLTPEQIRNVLNHMLTAAVFTGYKPEILGGSLELLTKSGKLIRDQEPDVGEVISSLGVTLDNAPFNVVKKVAEERGISPHPQPEDKGIYTSFFYYDKNPDADKDSLRNWLLNQPCRR